VVTDPDLIRLFIAPLEELKIPYVITGGVAAVIYGDPRFTRDIDVVLDLGVPDASRLAAAFSGGAFYVPPREALEAASRQGSGGHFNLIHRDTALRADVYVSGDDPLHAWAFARLRRVSVEGLEISVAPVEYVIVRKLMYYRDSGSERHLRDVAAMLQVSGAIVNQTELTAWIQRLELSLELAEASDLDL